MEAYTGGENGKGPEEGGGLDFLDELRNAKREDNRRNLNFLKDMYSIKPKDGIPETFSHFSLDDDKCEKIDKRNLALFIRLKDEGRNDHIQGFLKDVMGDTLRWSDHGTCKKMILSYEYLKTAADFASERGDIYQLVDADNLSAAPLDWSKLRQETEPVMLWVPRVLQVHCWHPRPGTSNRLPYRLLPAFNGDAIIGTSNYWKDDGKDIDERPIPARELSPGSRVTWVWDHEDMLDFLPQILKMASSGVELACDCEGTASGLSGKDGMSHFTMTSKTLNHTWVFRTQWIPGLFDIPGGEGQTLRSLLESKTIVQLWFDVRSDANAMFGVHGIRLGNVLDVQLMEGATRSGPRLRLQGLKQCVKNHGRKFMTHEEHRNWLAAKEMGHEFFRDNGWGVLEWAILPDEAMRYTAGDTVCLFGLERVYAGRMPSMASALQLESADTLMQMVKEASKVRLIESISDSFDADDTNRQAKRFLPAPICDLQEVWHDEYNGQFWIPTEEWEEEVRKASEADWHIMQLKEKDLERKKKKSAKLLKYKLKKKRLRRRGSTPRTKNGVTKSAFPRRAWKDKKATPSWRHVSK